MQKMLNDIQINRLYNEYQSIFHAIDLHLHLNLGTLTQNSFIRIVFTNI
jgi:hypothetical protein